MTNVLCIETARTKVAKVCYDTMDVSFTKLGKEWRLRDICIKFVDSCNAEKDYDWADIICGKVWGNTHPKVTKTQPEQVIKELYYGTTPMFYVWVSDYDMKMVKHIVTNDEVSKKEKLTGWFKNEADATTYAKRELASRIKSMEVNLERLKKFQEELS